MFMLVTLMIYGPKNKAFYSHNFFIVLSVITANFQHLLFFFFWQSMSNIIKTMTKKISGKKIIKARKFLRLVYLDANVIFDQCILFSKSFS